MISVPVGVTSVEQRAVRDAAETAGARRPAHLIPEPLAAAIGAERGGEVGAVPDGESNSGAREVGLGAGGDDLGKRGYGAGAGVTAAGVFADIIRIANI